LTRYALHSFPPAQILDIVTRYKNAVARLAGSVFGYRAGGWVIQPFDRLAAALRSNGIWLDSTVFPAASPRTRLRRSISGAPRQGLLALRDRSAVGSEPWVLS